MAGLSFFEQAVIAALPEAARLVRGSPANIAKRARELAEAACAVVGLDPPQPAASRRKRPGRLPKSPQTEKL